MAFTYDQTNLDTETESGRLNVVRLLLGDTDAEDPQLQDEEIQFSLSVTSDNYYSAASKSARYIAAKYARLVDTDLNGQLAEKYSQLQEHYANLATTLDEEDSSSNATLGISSGGVSKIDMEMVRCLPDRPSGSWVGQYDL